MCEFRITYKSAQMIAAIVMYMCIRICCKWVFDLLVNVYWNFDGNVYLNLESLTSLHRRAQPLSCKFTFEFDVNEYLNGKYLLCLLVNMYWNFDASVWLIFKSPTSPRRWAQPLSARSERSKSMLYVPSGLLCV